VYDLGANNGDDSDYYLKKGLRVVAVEANPILAQKLTRRFSGAIGEGRLTVLNFAMTNDNCDEIEFFINESDDKRSSVIRFAGARSVRVKARRLSELVREHGKPYYVKIDLEGSDVAVLRDLFGAGYRPPFISAEAYSIDILCHLVAAGYAKFKITEGRFVHCPYYRRPLQNAEGNLFEHHFPMSSSSGPFGHDIPGDWLSVDEAFQYLATFGLGWKDIHAMR
jgi:FkbM family methyltransferase